MDYYRNSAMAPSIHYEPGMDTETPYYIPRATSARIVESNIIHGDQTKIEHDDQGNNKWANRFKTVISIKSIILLLAAVLCMYQLVELLKSFFFGSRWGTTYRIAEKSGIRFPSMILCNANRVNASRATELGYSNDHLEVLLNESGLRDKYPQFDQLGSMYSLSDYVNMMMFYSVHPFTFLYPHTTVKETPTLKPQREFYKYLKSKDPTLNINNLATSLAHACEASVQSCKFMGNVLPPKMCCQNTRLLQTDLGMCLEHTPFTGTPIPTQTMAGPTGGYNLIYNLNKQEYVSTLIDNYADDGLFIYLSYGDEFVSPIAIQGGTHAFISLTSTRNELDESGLSFFSAPCEKNNETALLKRPYSQQKCREDCKYMNTAKMCNCMPAFKYGNYSWCEPDQVEECLFAKLRQEYIKAQLTGETALKSLVECETGCRPACSRDFVEQSVSYTKYPGDSKIQPIIALTKKNTNQTVTTAFLRDNLVVLDIYFDRMSCVIVERYPKATVEQLLGSIGGQLGLWLGASIITLYEAFIGVAIVCKCKKKDSQVGALPPKMNNMFFGQ